MRVSSFPLSLAVGAGARPAHRAPARSVIPSPPWREESVLWFVRRSRRGRRSLRCWLGTLRSRSFSDRQVFAHFFQALGAETANREEVIHGFERPVRFAHLQDFFRSGRPDPRHLLQLLGVRRIDVHRLRRRLLLSGRRRGKSQAGEEKEKKKANWDSPQEHSGRILFPFSI
jgi:hypothetical protein